VNSGHVCYVPVFVVNIVELNCDMNVESVLKGIIFSFMFNFVLV